ncbi:cytotoxic necrotizing factor Rho-activating domain-containing protein [Paraburkholderia xenovorans]|uniref:cytotoxic necrotizing factor Rho-activating domain-containing protein n=1 Tax=Paraburkholderia xenovorans TaxID=36873 RepID=UPI0038B7AA02
MKSRTAIAQIISADDQPLSLNGLLYRTSSGAIPVNFEVTTTSSQNPEEFSLDNPKFLEFIDTWNGRKTTSQKNNMWLGSWGSEHFLNDDFSIIEIRGEKSAVSAIRIDLREVMEGRPVIISGGELQGSTIVFALSGEGPKSYLYAFHAGYDASNPNWQPSQQGVAGIYQAHLSMGGEPIEDIQISDTGILVDEKGVVPGNRALGKMLGKYRQGFVAYSGGLRGSSPADIATNAAVEWVDYSANLAQGRGQAYALAVQLDGEGHIKLSAKAAPPPQSAGRAPK